MTLVIHEKALQKYKLKNNKVKKLKSSLINYLKTRLNYDIAQNVWNFSSIEAAVKSIPYQNFNNFTNLDYMIICGLYGLYVLYM